MILHDELPYGLDKRPDAREGVSLSLLLGKNAQPSLHHVQPRRTDRSEMELEFGMSAEPSLHAGMHVSVIVIKDHMQEDAE